MSKRRTPGEIVIKKAGAGFCGQRLVIKIPLTAIGEEFDYCMVSCDDNDCKEYANLEVIDEKGNVIGPIYHVSECQMEDLGN